MRISFDMDDTLVPGDAPGRARAECTLLSGDRLRNGSLTLLRELARDHELWIYTTSLRSPWQVKLGLRLKGVRIAKVITEIEHLQMLREYNFDRPPSKYPTHFGVDVHVDDSLGVLAEGEQFDFDVIRIDPADEQWTDTLRQAIAARESVPCSRC